MTASTEPGPSRAPTSASSDSVAHSVALWAISLTATPGSQDMNAVKRSVAQPSREEASMVVDTVTPGRVRGLASATRNDQCRSQARARGSPRPRAQAS